MRRKDTPLAVLVAEVREARLRLQDKVAQVRQDAARLDIHEPQSAVNATRARTRTLREQFELIRRQRHTIH